MSWSKEHSARHQELLLWIEEQQSIKHPLLLWLGKVDYAEAWLLITGVLYQKISLPILLGFLETVEKKWGKEVFALPEPSFEDLRKLAIEYQKLKYWPLLDVFPGIFWSVGAFLRKEPDVSCWKPESIMQIHYMGKNSQLPWKFHYLCFWLERIGCSLGAYILVPPVYSMEYMNRFGPNVWRNLKNYEEKCLYFDRFCRFLKPENPASVAYAFHFFKGYEEEAGFVTSTEHEKS